MSKSLIQALSPKTPVNLNLDATSLSGGGVGGGGGGEVTTGVLVIIVSKTLRLPMFLKHWRSFAQDATQSDHSYERFLLALAEHEVTQREQNRKERRIKAARFPVLKELSDFDFSSVPELNKAQVIQLAKGDYIPKAESVILIGTPGVGKPQPRKCISRNYSFY